MNNRILLFVFALVIIFFASCDNKEKTRKDQVDEFRSQLTYNDTTAMLQICDNAMELLKQKKYDEVLASMFIYDDSTKTVSPLPEKTANSYRRMFEMFPVLDYERVHYSFLLEGCNDVKYSVMFRTAEDAGTDKAPKTAYMFNPVKVADEWKLCIKTATDEHENSININN